MSQTIILPINVGQFEIDNGEPENDCSCPIALATGEALKLAGIACVEISVNSQCIWFEDGDGREWVGECTPEMGAFVEDFDHRQEVMPLSQVVEFVEDKVRNAG